MPGSGTRAPSSRPKPIQGWIVVARGRLHPDAMTRIAQINLLLLVLLSVSTGMVKIFQMPEEMALFAKMGFADWMTIAFGVLQAVLGLALIPHATRKLAATGLIATFIVATSALFVSGIVIFGVASLLFIAMAVLAMRPIALFPRGAAV